MRLGRTGSRLRWFSLLLPLLLFTGLRAEGDGWNEFLATWRKVDHAPATLLIPKDSWRASYPRSDEALLLLDATGDMKIQSVDGPSLAGLREARNWKGGPHWILLGRDGSILDEGTDLPKGDYLQSRLAGAGLPSTWEALDAFIREHPDNGSAIQRRLNIATGLARRRFWNLRDQGKVQGARLLSDSLLPGMEPAKLVDQALPDEWCKEVEDSLRLLNQLPDPWRMGDRFLFQFWLELYGKIASTGLRVEILKLMDAVQGAWSRSPHSGRNPMQTAQTAGDPFGLGNFWMACEAASRPSSALPELPSLTPSPGRFWPDSGVMNLFWARPGRVPGQELMVFLDRIPPMDWESIPWNETWSDWVGFRSYLSYLRGMSLANLGRWQEAISALQECRRLAGKHWAESAPQMLAWFSPSTSPEVGKPPAPAKPSVPEPFLQVLRLPPLEDLTPPPPQASLRFIVWDQPKWVALWEALRASAPLAPWGPSELVRAVPSDSDTERMKQAGFPATGWAVFQGHTTIVARGAGRPDAAQLAAQLRSVAPSKIHLLDDFVAKHPEHLDARRDRLALVKARMPQASLEARFQEDATAALLPLDFGPDAAWISDLEGWRNRARKVVPELEVILQRWPDNAVLWQSWISWNAFLPVPRSVMAFATDLPVFGPRRAWLSRLPAPVHRAVSVEGRQTRRYGPVLDWFEGAWAELRIRTRILRPPLVEEREKAIYEGYREALVALGRKAECPELDQEWTALQAKAKAVQESD